MARLPTGHMIFIVNLKPQNTLYIYTVHVQILQTDLYTFSQRVSGENLIKDQGIFSLVIILLVLIT